MRELIELQTGQVAFISGLMSGFSLSVAAHVLRYGIRSRVAQAVFLMLLLASLLFLVALYVDTRLYIELAGLDALDALDNELAGQVADVRLIGTTSATFALFLFVVAIGLLGWLATPFTGFASSLMAGGVLYALWLVLTRVAEIGELIKTG